ncbi:hypothetical protein, partial [Streptomyces xylophagus]|uniref:hypothetical protein n=1 Tax=Streptomyces xylophagus TaxID=285514 RepID=UPI001F401862
MQRATDGLGTFGQPDESQPAPPAQRFGVGRRPPRRRRVVHLHPKPPRTRTSTSASTPTFPLPLPRPRPLP